MSKKKIVFFLLFISFFSLIIYADKQSELDAINQQLKDIEKKKIENNKKMSILNQNIVILDNEIAIIQANLDYTKREIDKTQAKIDDNTKKIISKEKEIYEITSKLKTRIRVMSKIKYIDYLKIIFSSKSVKDFFSKYTVIKKIVDQDKFAIEYLENTKKDLVSISDDLEESKSILDTLKTDYNIQNDNLESAKLMQQANLAMVEKDNAQLQELENLKQHEAAQLAEEIRLMVMTSNYQGSYTGGRLGLPVANVRITSPFGYRIHPILNTKMFHSGVDFADSAGTHIYAAEEGQVIYAGPKGTYGNAVMIDHGAGIVTLYGHCSSVAVQVGQIVKRGELVAYMGSTGRSTGPHLHFEVRLNGEFVDPMPYLRGE
jgi:peptidase M23B